MMLLRDSFRGQVRIHQFHEFSLKATRVKRTVTCRVMDHAGDGRCKHLSDNSAKLSRYAAGAGDNDGFIALLKNHCESIMCRFGIFAAWNFLQQHPMRCLVSAVDADHAVDKRLDSASAWQFLVSSSTQDG